MLRFLVTAILLLAALRVAFAQEHRHPPEHAAIHDQFYSKWNRPDNRFMSCCNQQDCAPVKEVRYWNGALQMRRESDGYWLTIPPEKLEQNYDDARDSPDGGSHLCSIGETVFCAVLGTGM